MARIGRAGGGGFRAGTPDALRLRPAGGRAGDRRASAGGDGTACRPLPGRARGGTEGARATGTQRVAFADGAADAALYARAELGAGDALEGPAIIQQLDTTTLVPPGWRAVAHASGSLLLERR
ncbi:hypothetical protein ACE7GA_22430 [Roseomonas sp. CCTCC AB2023176]|uniref:hypothetical protein n=1 Tax=Roseomonas sp. CCTCC AB2023176 TaxID=3342640 RepID=UPI0035DE6F34